MTENLFSGQIFVLLLLSLLAGVYAVQRLLPKLGRRSQAADRLQTLGFLPLTPQCSVALVRVGHETLVLGLTPHAVTLLTKTGSLIPLDAQSTEQETTGRSDEGIERALTQVMRATL